MIETLWSVRSELALVAAALFWPAVGLVLCVIDNRRLHRMAQDFKEGA